MPWTGESGARVLGLLCFVLLAVSSCSDDPHAGVWSGTPKRDPDPSSPDSCEPGSNRECHVTLNEREGVLTCLAGIEECTSGVWGPCEGTALTTEASPFPPGGLRAQSLSSPSECDPENPCDPSCLEYSEEPSDPLEADSTGGDGFDGNADWQWGSLSDFPGGLVNKGLNDPCSSAYECQFDMYCLNPAAGSCSHALCEAGAALTYDCDGAFGNADSCTGMICDIDPSCCSAPAACTHDPCVSGTKLKSDCDPCVAQICAADPTCCSSAWSASCVAKVSTTCGNTCACDTGQTLYNGRCYARENDLDRWSNQENDCIARGTGWELIEINDSGENTWLKTLSTWGADDLWIGVKTVKVGPNWFWKNTAGNNLSYINWETGYGTAASNKAGFLHGAGTGKWRDAANSSNKKAVCEGPTSKMVGSTPVTYEWTSACADMVETVCGAVCDSSSSASGECKGWKPGETSPNCDGDGSPGSPNIDLAVAPTCDGMIPVCNHGTGTAPAGIVIASFQGYSSHFPLCAPDFDASDLADSCVTTEPIPPGECIEVTGCDLDNNGGVLVNPHGSGLNPVEECSCLDNWSLVHPSSDCGAPTCGTADGFYDELVDDCELTLPDEDYADSAHLILTHVYDDGVAATTDTPVEFEYVSSLASCTTTTDHHFRFDNAANPTKIVLCPKTCQRVQAAAFASSDVWVELSCADLATYSETSFVQTYEGACGYQRGVQWADLAFSADIPSDSRIIWKVAAAADPADLPDDAADSGWVTLGTSTSGEEDCAVGSGCELDVFEALGGLPTARLEHIAILITLVPSSNETTAPTVDDWQVTYSCPFNQ